MEEVLLKRWANSCILNGISVTGIWVEKKAWEGLREAQGQKSKQIFKEVEIIIVW